MSLLVAFLVISGVLLWVALIGAGIFGVFFRGATAEDRATVDLPDVDVDLRVRPFVGVRPHLVPVDDCDACTGRDRGAF